MSRRPGWIHTTGPTCGTTSTDCVIDRRRPSCSPRTTSRRPMRRRSECSLLITGRSSPTTPRQISRRRLAGDRIMITVDGAYAAAASAVVGGRGKELTTSNGSREVTIAGRFEHGTRTLPCATARTRSCRSRRTSGRREGADPGRCLFEPHGPKLARGKRGGLMSTLVA